MKKIDYAVRVLSLAPLLASVMLIVLYACDSSLFGSAWSFVSMLVTLGVFPLTAYPLQRFMPKFKDQGRRGQRNLAMIFAVIGYIACTLILLITGGTREEYFICLTYLVSGALLLIVNKVLKIHASGHGCGICGPVSLLLILDSYAAAAVYAVSAIFVCIASVRSKRHTLPQFIGGGAISVVTSTVLAVFILWI